MIPTTGGLCAPPTLRRTRQSDSREATRSRFRCQTRLRAAAACTSMSTTSTASVRAWRSYYVTAARGPQHAAVLEQQVYEPFWAHVSRSLTSGLSSAAEVTLLLSHRARA
jgi:hypothetical protein